jgi:hypothetical protein
MGIGGMGIGGMGFMGFGGMNFMGMGGMGMMGFMGMMPGGILATERARPVRTTTQSRHRQYDRLFRPCDA